MVDSVQLVGVVEVLVGVVDYVGGGGERGRGWEKTCLGWISRGIGFPHPR